MRRLPINKPLALTLIALLLGFMAFSPEPAYATAQYGGTILYYDENWNLVGYWYKPCIGNSTRWGVVGVHAVIDDFWVCSGNPPDNCTPVVTFDAPVGSLPSPSLVDGI
jgi:hypothetical protein